MFSLFTWVALVVTHQPDPAEVREEDQNSSEEAKHLTKGWIIIEVPGSPASKEHRAN